MFIHPYLSDLPFPCQLLTDFFLVVSFLVLLGSCSWPAEPVFDKEFSNDQQDSLPSVSTTSISSITENSAQSGGSITDDGGTSITSRGVCWSVTQNPDKDDECTTNGSGIGEFTSNITGLNADTRYFLRAYAENNIGLGFGEEREFKSNVGETERPKIEILNGPEDGSTVAYNNPEFTWNGNDPDGEVQEYDVELSGPEDQQFTTPEESHQFENLPNGSYTFQVRSVDEQGAKSPWASRTFTVEVEDNSSDWPRDTETEVIEVTSATGRVWMDRNLGASRAATSPTDEQAYGDLYQWGRASDGHQYRESATTSTLSDSDLPGHEAFILSPDNPWDWRSTKNNDLWQGANGINNPCPQDFRLPSEAEWEAERKSWSSNNAEGAFSSSLKLPLSGTRNYSNGELFAVDTGGRYWSKTLDGYARSLEFDSNEADMHTVRRAVGRSVRCIKD